MLWTVPKLWTDGTCWILGGGPSLVKEFDIPPKVVHSVVKGTSPSSTYSPYLAALHDKHVIGINNAYRIGDWLEFLFFGDCSWYLSHRVLLAQWSGIKVTCCKRFHHRSPQNMEGIKFLDRARDPNTNKWMEGISRHPSYVAWNKNSGAASISLAYHLGARRIVLLGFDMKLDGNAVSHWDGYHKDKFPKGPPKMKPHTVYSKHLKGFNQIAKDATELGIEILNASTDSALTQFPIVRAKDVLEDS